MKLRVACSVVLMLVACAIACGEEVVDLSPAVGADAGSEGQAAMGFVDGCAPSTVHSCAPDGARCATAAACCSNRCESGFCLPSGVCMAPGSKCSARSTCCSGRCEATGSELACLAYCVIDGSPCDGPQDCCSAACHANMCGGAICKVVDSTCTEDDECCSRACNGGVCQLDSSLVCRPSSEGCTGGGSAIACCSGVCNSMTNRCDPGPGACRDPGVPCLTKADCCRGDCTPAGSGVPVCTSPCLPDTAGCNSAADCCSGVCEGLPSTCGAPTPFCGG